MFGTATPKTRAADSTDQAFHPIFSADRPLLADGREVTDTNGQMQQQHGENSRAILRPGLPWDDDAVQHDLAPAHQDWCQSKPPLLRKEHRRKVERVGQAGVNHHRRLRVQWVVAGRIALEQAAIELAWKVAGIHVLLILMGHERHKVCGREDLRPCQPFARRRGHSADEHRDDGADARPLRTIAVQQHYVVAPAPRCSPKNAKTRLHASSAAARL